MFGKKGFSNGESISIPEFLSPVQQKKEPISAKKSGRFF
jgi:hypothetical protein